MMKNKKMLALVMAGMMMLSATACGGKEVVDQGQSGGPTQGQVEDVEVNKADKHMNSFEASTSGNWEAMFVPLDVDGRAIDMENFDLTPTAEELEAMKKEPAYGKPVMYYMSDGCTSGPTVANHLGYYKATNCYSPVV